MAQHYSFTTFKCLPGAAVLLVAAAMLAGCSRSQAVDPAESATVEIERKPNKQNGYFSRGSHSLDVTINSVKVGSIANGHRETFPFTPNPAKNTILIADGNNVSKVMDFEAGRNSMTKLVCRYLDEQDSTGYDIIVRPAEDGETPVVNKGSGVKVLSVVPDPQLQSEVIEKYPPITLPAGVKKSFTRKVETYDHTAIIDTDVFDQTKVFKIGATGLLGPIVAAIKDAGIEVRQVRTRKEIKEHTTKMSEIQKLEITGDGKPKTLFWRRNYQVGTAKVMVDDKTFDVPFKVTKDSFLLAE
jgi:hypothetical protein